MRLLYMLPLSLIMLFSVQAGAGEKVLIGMPLSKSQSGQQQKKWYYPFEIGELSIKQSNNGTGIINDVSCPDCDYQFVKITQATKVIVNGQKANLLRARERAGKPVYIEFDKKTAEVKYIYWAE